MNENWTLKRATPPTVRARRAILGVVQKFQREISALQVATARARLLPTEGETLGMLMRVGTVRDRFLAETRDLTDADGLLADILSSLDRLSDVMADDEIRPRVRSLRDTSRDHGIVR
jgi:hypothetical protein